MADEVLLHYAHEGGLEQLVSVLARYKELSRSLIAGLSICLHVMHRCACLGRACCRAAAFTTLGTNAHV